MIDNVINEEKVENPEYDPNVNEIQVPNKVARVSDEVPTEKKG